MSRKNVVRIISLILVLVLSVSIMAVPAFAATSKSLTTGTHCTVTTSTKPWYAIPLITKPQITVTNTGKYPIAVSVENPNGGLDVEYLTIKAGKSATISLNKFSTSYTVYISTSSFSGYPSTATVTGSKYIKSIK